MKKLIENEKILRTQFMSEYGRILPSDFLPQLRELTPQVKLEGSCKDYELPELEDDYEDAASLITDVSVSKSP